MRLIDADACIDYIRNNNQHAWDALAYAPTIDAVEVVRCKDCKHRHEDECPMFVEDYDTDYIFHDYTQDYGYCNWGERREP